MKPYSGRRAKQLFSVVAAIISLNAWAQPQATLSLIYAEDFSKDPAWVTDDTAKMRWDSASGSLHCIQVNTEGTYAYAELPSFDARKAWRLEFDCIINACDWSAGPTFGLLDSTLLYNRGVTTTIGIADIGRFISLETSSGGDSSASPEWAIGRWYHSVIAYDPATQKLTSQISERSTGAPHMTLSCTIASPPSSLKLLGTTRLYMKGGVPGASGSASTDYNLDNIKFFADTLPLIYAEDFSKESAWVTDDAAKMRWDSASGSLHCTQVNTAGTYAYAELPSFDANKAWRLEFDCKINSCDWSAGPTFGFLDSTLLYNRGVTTTIGIADIGRFISLETSSGGDSSASPEWAIGKWYHSVIAYDPVTQKLTSEITERSTGTPHMGLSCTVASLPSNLRLLGTTRLHMKGGVSGASDSASTDYNLDNIKLFADPLPLIYAEDFSNDPAWVTDDVGKMRWDSVSGSLHCAQVNTAGTYAYAEIPPFNPNKAWKLEFDCMINSCDWSAGPTFGLLDSTLLYNHGVTTTMGVSDIGRFVSLETSSGGDSSASPEWAIGRWYHSVIAFDPITHRLTSQITDRSTSARHMALSWTVDSLPSSLGLLGATRLHMKGGVPGASGSASTDYNLDNIELFASEAPPFLLTKFATTTASVGGNVSFCVTTSGAEPLSYKWFLNEVPLVESGPCLTLSGLQPQQAGLYSVVVANQYGSTTNSAILGLTELRTYAGISLYGPVGSKFRIECKNSLEQTDWTFLSNASITSGPFFWLDTDSAAHARRFYRAVPLP